MKKLAYVGLALLVAVWLAWLSYSIYLFYFAPCQKVKDAPIPAYAPNRCIP